MKEAKHKMKFCTMQNELSWREKSRETEWNTLLESLTNKYEATQEADVSLALDEIVDSQKLKLPKTIRNLSAKSNVKRKKHRRLILHKPIVSIPTIASTCKENLAQEVETTVTATHSSTQLDESLNKMHSSPNGKTFNSDVKDIILSPSNEFQKQSDSSLNTVSDSSAWATEDEVSFLGVYPVKKEKVKYFKSSRGKFRLFLFPTMK